jgi:hypothetical protein
MSSHKKLDSIINWILKLVVFNVEEDDEPEEIIPKNAKVSKNIGRDTPRSAGPNNFGKYDKIN